MKVIILTILLFLIIHLSAQDTKSSFSEKTNQHSITAEYLALSYSFAHQFKPNLVLGVRGQVGFATRFMLINSSFEEDYYVTIDEHIQETYNVNQGSTFIDIFKLQVFYRNHLPKHFCFDIGPYASIGYLSGMHGGFNWGLETSIYYSYKKMHVGTRFQAGWQLIHAQSSSSSYFGLYSTPLVIGFSF